MAKTPDKTLIPLPADKNGRQQAFLDLVQSRHLKDFDAVLLSGIDPHELVMWKRDPKFLKRYYAARRFTVRDLRREAERRAFEGSDRLMEFLLRAYKPEVFDAPQKVDMTVKGDIAARIIAARKRA